MSFIKINLPTQEDILKRKIKIHTAEEGKSWLKAQLGDHTDMSGVYVFISNDAFLYVGKTSKGSWGKFSERIRRHCQFTSSQNSKMYQNLSKAEHSIFVSLFPCDEIANYIEFNQVSHNEEHNKERMCLLFEQAMICYLGTFELNIR